ncbi:MAG: M28 family peptidase [Anaerolineales bacterium]|nr:MAG: M28 family peptidase [Anaerolineales bacterium]
MTEKIQEGLQTENLMTHMRVLCKEIGPRPPTSAQERQAAEYVEKTLKTLGYQNIREQHFKSQNSFGWVVIPASLAAVLGMPIAALGGRLGKAIGSLLLLGGAHTLKELGRARPPFFQRLIARRTSQNLIVEIPPTGKIERQVFLIGHLDTQRQRFITPPPRPELMKPISTAALLLATLGGISLLTDVLFKRKGVARWQWLTGLPLSAGLLSFLFDETQPHIEGANDNATAVAILLSIAEALKAAPLKHTQVTLLFTGCEEAVCVGMESYLQHFAPPQDSTYWIDLEMVGTGNLCYVTQHGLTYVTEYYPDPEMVKLAAQTALKHPELGVTGKDMLILEEVSNLCNHGYKAICIAGYDKGGWLPNWHRLSDNLENIEPDTLSRAARYTWALLQELDNLGGQLTPQPLGGTPDSRS